MPILHLVFALAATTIIWLFSGVLIEATDRVAKRFNKPGFFVAFFVLGLLTSVSETSVAVNATLRGVPQVSAGNLVGASLVIFLLLIPLLAIVANGVEMKLTLSKHHLMLLMMVVLTPALFALDGVLSVFDGGVMLLLYAMLVYAVKNHRGAGASEKAVKQVERELLQKRTGNLQDFARITAGALAIFIAGKILVDEAVFFSHMLNVPPSFIGLLVLSIGTNVPELTIAIRCALEKRNGIAFGDYLGSAAANTLLTGFLPLVNGPFLLEGSEFLSSFLLMIPGLTLFYLFAQSQHRLTRKEGIILLSLYACFVLSQLVNVSLIVPAVRGALVM